MAAASSSSKVAPTSSGGTPLMQRREFQSKGAVAKPDVTGCDLVTVVSYNIGAKTSQMVAKDREKFLAKLCTVAELSIRYPTM